jgi:hypothetical protein
MWAMAKSVYAYAVDDIQAALRPFLHEHGYRVRGRTFNRKTEDGLIEVVNIQMWPSDPPGTTYYPGLRENLHGLFTINLGVFVPEVARYRIGLETKPWIREHECCIRARLGQVSGEKQDLWWYARSDQAVVDDVQRRLEQYGLPFVARFSTRDKILAEWRDRSENLFTSDPPRIVMAIILTERGERDRARALLALQTLETHNPAHPESVRRLAQKLGLGNLDE